MNDRDRQAARLLRDTGYHYTCGSQKRRGLVMLLLAHRMTPDDPQLLRCLSEAFIAQQNGSRALGVLTELERLEGETDTLRLLRSRALWAAGEYDDARRHFRDYLRLRGTI